MLGLRCCAGFSVVEAGGNLLCSCGSWALVASLAVEQWLGDLWASVVVAPGLWSTGSVVVLHGLSCSVSCGVFPDQ